MHFEHLVDQGQGWSKGRSRGSFGGKSLYLYMVKINFYAYIVDVEA